MADALSPPARAFYEQTKYKMMVSLFLGSMACLALAYCSGFGGESNSAQYLRKYIHDMGLNDDYRESSEQALVGGYGK
jgi:hypothetical protein